MTSLTIRATEVAQTGVVLKLGDQIIAMETEPRMRWAVSVDQGGDAIEIAALFDTQEQATEAAQALTAQLRAELGNEGSGPRLATKDGVTIQ